MTSATPSDAPASAGPMRSGRPRRRPAAALIVIGAVSLAVSGGLAFGYLHYEWLVVAQEQTIRRVTVANLDLQDSLDRVRDEIQQKFEQLNAERDALQARVRALEKELSTLQAGNGKRAKAAPLRAARAFPVPLPGVRESLLKQEPVERSSVSGHASNFIPPSWAPDYFSNESGLFSGAGASSGPKQR